MPIHQKTLRTLLNNVKDLGPKRNVLKEWCKDLVYKAIALPNLIKQIQIQ